jgi:uncharacterized repeat protein (TIGR03803 family)
MLSELLPRMLKTQVLWSFNLVIAMMLVPAGRANAQDHRIRSSADPTVTPVYNFGFDRSNGHGSVSNLVADQQGSLYGTTYEGGSAGYGTVFKLTPPAKGQSAWTQTVLYSFCQQSGCSDGSYPVAGLVFARQPNGITALFGTTQAGGDLGQGTIFRLLPPGKGQTAWTQVVLYSFQGGSDGSDPLGSLIADNRGVLYGTTNGGARETVTMAVALFSS